MNTTNKVKSVLFATLGLAAVGGVSAVAVACGADTSIAKGVYYSQITAETYAKLKSDKTILLWLPWAKHEGGAGSYSDGAALFFSRAFGVDFSKSDTGVVTTGALKGYSVELRYTDSTAKALDYETLGNITTFLSSGDAGVIPDVAVNYGEMGAILAQNGILHDLGEAGRKAVVPGFAADVNSVLLPDGSKPSYLLPFAKSTEAAGVDIVVFAKTLADTAASISELYPDRKTFKVVADSDVDRMIRMVLAPSTVSTVSGAAVVNLAMSDIYAANAKKGAEGTVAYAWQDLADAWTRKTAAGGIWAPDRPLVEANYKFLGTEAAKKALAAIDYSAPLLGTYRAMKDYVMALMTAYQLKKTSDFATSSFFMGLDVPNSAVLSYQYDSSGHTADKLAINTSPVTIGSKSVSGVLRYDVYDDSAPARNFQAGASWVSDLVNSGAAYLKSSKTVPYGSGILQKHGIFFSIGSTNGLPFYTDSRNVINYNEKTNIGEVYFTLQPTRVDAASESKRSVINQGPSLFVTDIHGKEVGKMVADAILGSYSQGAQISNGVDTGYWGKAGYIYGNVESYGADGKYLQTLNDSLADPTKWANTVGKKLYVDHVENAVADPSGYDLITNPLDRNTRNFKNFLDAIYNGAFVNFFQGSGRLPDGVEVARQLIANCYRDGWLKLAE